MQRHTLLLPQSLLRLRGGMYALWGTATPSSTCEAAAAVLQSCRRVHPAASLQWQWPGASTRPLASEAVAAADVDDKDADVNLELGMAEVAGIAGKTSRRARRRAAAARRAAVAQTTLAALATHPASRLGLPAALVEDDRHPIRDEHLSSAAWLVLSRLRGAGHEAYVVGGTVRDILLGGTPKDYDLLTSAEPHQVRELAGKAWAWTGYWAKSQPALGQLEEHHLCTLACPSPALVPATPALETGPQAFWPLRGCWPLIPSVSCAHKRHRD